MKQVVQNLKTGNIYVDKVPLPNFGEATVLVENQFSLVSDRLTRGKRAEQSRNTWKNLRDRPDLVVQVLQNLRKRGLQSTIQKFIKELDLVGDLGYSSSGIVLASRDTQGLFVPGDRVACSGEGYASHAEIVSVPQNLVAKIPDEVSLEEAAFAALGAIALRGVQKAAVSLGENACVIGLGLLGQITCQLLRANGCFVCGVDTEDYRVKQARDSSAHEAFLANDRELGLLSQNYTDGRGFDIVIIASNATSRDSMKLAGELIRRKGRVVFMSEVPMNIPVYRDYSRKEVEILMAHSLKSSRDHPYEKRTSRQSRVEMVWTEQQDMSTFLDLLSRRAIGLHPLISRVIDIDEAAAAHDLLSRRKEESHLGILLSYPSNKRKFDHVVELHAGDQVKDWGVSFIGVGSTTERYLIPTVQDMGGSLEGVAADQGLAVKRLGAKFEFKYCTTDVEKILSNANTNIVFIATPTSTHAPLTIRALTAKKHTFVETPLALNEEELISVMCCKDVYEQALMVGFNRRFAPISRTVREQFAKAKGPLVVNIRVKTSYLSNEILSPQGVIGRDRLMGDMCHFVDLLQFFTGADPTKVYAECINRRSEVKAATKDIVVMIRLSDGSIGNLIYVLDGDTRIAQEHIEVYGASSTAVFDDFKRGTLSDRGKSKKLRGKSMGYQEATETFMNSLKRDGTAPISFKSICLTTYTALKIQDSLATGLPQKISWDFLKQKCQMDLSNY